MRISIIGAPGSGKTTQAERLGKALGVEVFSLGEELRKLAQGEGEQAKEVEEILDRGDLVSGELSFNLLEEKLKQIPNGKGFILDGMPRTVEEARSLASRFALNKVFHLQVRIPVARERLMRRGREDDRLEIIQRRFEVHRNHIDPILSFYRNLGILEEVDATSASIQDVSHEIMSNLQ